MDIHSKSKPVPNTPHSFNQNVTTYYAFVDCGKGNDSGTFSTNLTEAPTWKTLQYALNCTSNFAINDSFVSFTVYIMPGTYNGSAQTLNRSFSLIANSCRTECFSTPDVIISPPNQTTSFITSSGDSLFLEGLHICNFSSCLNLQKVGVVSINNCNFFNNINIDQPSTQLTYFHTLDFSNSIYSSNTWIYIRTYEHAKSNIFNSSFIKNFNSGTNQQGGGALNVVGSLLTINCSHFAGNNAYTQGGAINYQGSSLTVHDSIFENNCARNMVGGAISVFASQLDFKNDSFFQNSAPFGIGTLAVCGNPVGTIDNCNFTLNQAQQGGAIGVNTDSGQISISQCSFCGNNGECGSALYIENGSVEVSHCNFTSNNAREYGGIYNLGFLKIKFSNFTSNFAFNFGGAVNNLRNATIENSTFAFNTAISNGGAIYSEGNLTLSNSNFSYNSAQNHGGVVYIGGNPNCTRVNSVTVCNFTSNSANCGAAIFSEGNLLLRISNCTFSSNNVSNFGGAIHVVLGNTTIENSTFTGNQAGIYGGAASFLSGYLLVSGSNFTSNSANNQGGAIYIDKHSLNTRISFSRFSSNQATYSGGAVFLNSRPLTLCSNNFTSNSAENGGTVAITGDSCISSTNDTFLSNSAISGGTFYSEQSANLTFNSSVFSNNTATNNGGVLSMSASILHFNNCTLSDNSAGSNGGVIHCAKDCTVKICNNTNLSNNSAQNFGGVLSLNGGRLIIERSFFCHNSAPNSNGGAIWIQSTTTNIIESAFEGNCASATAGVLYFSHSQTNLIPLHSKDNTWRGNSIKKGGFYGSCWLVQGNVSVYRERHL